MKKMILFFFLVFLTQESWSSQGESIVYQAHDNTQQHAYYFKAQHPKAALIFIHGLQSHSGWIKESGVGEALADSGISVFAYDRRGSGKSTSLSGHADNAHQLLLDLHDALLVFDKEMNKQGLSLWNNQIPLHMMANCFGARIAVPYMAQMKLQGQNLFKSLIVMAPSTHMRKNTEYNVFERLSLLPRESTDYVKTPLKDEWFVSSGPGLRWIQEDSLALRAVTKGFLMSAKTLTKSMQKDIYQMTTPLLILGANRDAMVDTERVQNELYARYQGPKQMKVLNSEHSLEFGGGRDAMIQAVKNWVFHWNFN